MDFQGSSESSDGDPVTEEISIDQFSIKAPSQLNDSTLGLRSSLTSKYIEKSSSRKGSLIDDAPSSNLQVGASTATSRPLNLANQNNCQRDSSPPDESESKALFEKLNIKFQKIGRIGEQLEDLDMAQLEEKDKVKLALTLSRAIEKISNLQQRFLKSSS
jgi:hypothetical protein